jgi:hypothetical protein
MATLPGMVKGGAPLVQCVPDPTLRPDFPVIHQIMRIEVTSQHLPAAVPSKFAKFPFEPRKDGWGYPPFPPCVLTQRNHDI